MKVKELLEAIDSSIHVKVRSHDYADFYTEAYCMGSTTTYSLYNKIKDYVVMNISYMESNDENHDCWLLVDAWEHEGRTNNGEVVK